MLAAVVFSVIGRISELEAKTVAVNAEIHAMEDSVISDENAITFSDGSMGDVWLARLDDVPENPYDPELFYRDDNGLLRYSDEENAVEGKVGIDVSYFQGDIDWEKVRESGVDFAMLRIGYRGYESGQLNEDERFAEYVKGAEKAGIDVGVYFFSQAVTPEEALNEAAGLHSGKSVPKRTRSEP